MKLALLLAWYGLLATALASDPSNAIGQNVASIFGDVTQFVGGACPTANFRRCQHCTLRCGPGGHSRGSWCVPGQCWRAVGPVSGLYVHFLTSATCKGAPTVSASNPSQSYKGAIGTIHSIGESAQGASTFNGPAAPTTAAGMAKSVSSRTSDTSNAMAMAATAASASEGSFAVSTSPANSAGWRTAPSFWCLLFVGFVHLWAVW